jgi:hypothetical protein
VAAVRAPFIRFRALLIARLVALSAVAVRQPIPTPIGITLRIVPAFGSAIAAALTIFFARSPAVAARLVASAKGLGTATRPVKAGATPGKDAPLTGRAFAYSRRLSR